MDAGIEATTTECGGGGCGKCCGDGKPCGTGSGCREDCAVSCTGAVTFGDEERLRRLVEYREMLEAELDSVEVAIAAMQATCPAPETQADQELIP